MRGLCSVVARLGHRSNQRSGHIHLLPEGTGGQGHHRLAGSQPHHAGAHRLDHAHAFRAQRVGLCGIGVRVLAHGDQHVAEVQAGGLDTDALVKILTVPKNSIVQQYKKLFELDGVELLFEEEALRAIAQQAQDQHTGARGLRGIMEDILTDLMFEAPSDPTIDKIIITEGVIKNGAAPQITRKKELLQTNSVKLTQKDAKKRQKRSTAS